MEVLDWARANGCPWDRVATCACAARRGHLDVLQWARANGCEWELGLENGKRVPVHARQGSPPPPPPPPPLLR